tara:strand:- start:151 stop:501 length:351 start_codon:yes stop_codon:yes gene_type:complete
MYMNHTNTSVGSANPWVESSAMVYVALTVATFSAVVICGVWVFKEKYRTSYHTVHAAAEETVELRARHTDDSSEDIPLDELDGALDAAAAVPEAKLSEAFSLGDDEASDDDDVHTV